jgi:lipopolysaccharide biosynthesis glycosyltransferase
MRLIHPANGQYLYVLIDMKTTLAVVVNRAFVIGYKAMMNSILAHTNFNLPVVCIDLDLTPKDREIMLKLYRKTTFIKPIEENYAKLPTHAPALRNAFYKVEVLRVAQDYDRTVFIDCDIVFIDSILPLLQTDTKSDIAACMALGQHKEVNTGVMVFGKLSSAQYEKTISMMKTMKRAHLGDQPVIINAIQKKILSYQKLHNKWNTTKREARKGNYDFIGLHFVGAKPWKSGEPGYEHLEKIWLKYSK